MNAIAFLPAPQTIETEAPAIVIPSATMSRAGALAALVAACNIMERRNKIPILSNVLIREAGAGVEIVGTDLDIWFRAVIPGEVSPGFAVTVPAIGLRDVLKLSKAEDVTLTDVAEGALQLTMGEASATLQALPADDFPPLPSFKGTAPTPADDDDAPDKLPPDPEGRNDERAAWAEAAVNAFIGVCRTDPEDAIADLITNLRHLCDREHATYGTFEAALRRGNMNYEAETEAVEDDVEEEGEANG